MYTEKHKVSYSESSADWAVDIAGIAQYFQDIGAFHSEQCRYGLFELMKQSRAWILATWQIGVMRYPTYNEEIEIGTAATGFTSLYAEREYAIRDAGGEVLARAFARWIMLDFESGHPLRMTPDITDHYVMEPSLGMEHLPRRIACREEGEPQTPFEVFRGCIDTNGHVNNSWYIRFAQNYLPEGFTVRSMRVEYRNAAVLGDMICPYVIRQDGGIIVKLCAEDKDTYAVIAFYGEKQEKA